MPKSFQLSYSTTPSGGKEPPTRRASISTVMFGSGTKDKDKDGKEEVRHSSSRRYSLLSWRRGTPTSTLPSVEESSKMLNGTGDAESFSSDVDSSTSSQSTPIPASSPIPVAVPLSSSPSPLTNSTSEKTKANSSAATPNRSEVKEKNDSLGENLAYNQFTTLCIVGAYGLLFLLSFALLDDLIVLFFFFL